MSTLYTTFVSNPALVAALDELVAEHNAAAPLTGAMTRSKLIREALSEYVARAGATRCKIQPRRPAVARLSSTPAHKADAPQPTQAQKNAGAVHQLATKGIFGHGEVRRASVGSSSGIGAAIAGSALDQLSPIPRQEAKKAAPSRLDPRVAALTYLSDDARRLLNLIVSAYGTGREGAVEFTAAEAAKELEITIAAAHAARDELQARTLITAEQNALGTATGWRPTLQ